MFKQLRLYSIAMVLPMLCLLAPVKIVAANRHVDLTIANKMVTIDGHQLRSIAVNGQIPGPTLHFREGDHVTISVHNHLRQNTTLHWHGLLVPWQMDGVANVSQRPIPPGQTFQYRYTLHQSGTYWYHSHTGLQEQDGVYGGLIIAPRHKKWSSNKDFMLVLSDWINSGGDQVFANLKKTGDFYSVRFPLQSSLVQFYQDMHAAGSQKEKSKVYMAYMAMQKSRMGVYDISDVAYNAFLLNGRTKQSPWKRKVNVGDIVRLRLVGAGSSTIFKVQMSRKTMMTVIQVDGRNVKPHKVKSLLIAPGETVDVLVKIRQHRPYVVNALSIDGIGSAIGVLQTDEQQSISAVDMVAYKKPKPRNPMRAMMVHPPKKAVVSTHSQYDVLEATFKSNDPTIQPSKTIHVTLSGFMDRYMWFINGVPYYKAKPIMVKHGKRYRIIFTNKTSMYHPMHIHGHWFILRNGHGRYDPLLHTINLPPGAVIVADLDANTLGQWFMHCHNLYHLSAGMANIVRYEDTPSSHFAGLNGDRSDGPYMSTSLDVNTNLYEGQYQVSFKTQIGSSKHVLQIYADEAEITDNKVTDANLDVFYLRWLNQFWAVKAGINSVYRPAAAAYIQPGFGLEGTLPYSFEVDLRTYLRGNSVKLDAEIDRDIQLSRKVHLSLGVEGIAATATLKQDEIGSGLNSVEWTVRPYYQLSPNIQLYVQYQHTNYYGPLKNILISQGEETSENRYALGFAYLL